MKPFCIMTNKGLAVKQHILERYATKSESKQIPTDTFQESYGADGVVAPMYNPDALIRVMDSNTYHARCCKAKARDSAGLGWEIIPVGENQNEASKDKLQAFFENQPDLLTETLYRYQLDQESIGFSAIEIIRKDMAWDGEPEEIHHIPAHTLRRHTDGKRVVQRRGSKKRYFRVAGVYADVHYKDGTVKQAGALTKDQRASEIIWGVNYDPRSSFYGAPDFIPALGTISSDYYRREYNRTFFENYGIPSYAVFITGNYDPGEEDADGKTPLEKEIQEHFSEIAKNPHQTLILALPTRGGDDSNVEITFKPLATDIKEASFRLFRKDNRDEIIVAHGVDPYRISIMETGSLAGNLGKQATENYKASVVEPRQNLIEDAVNLHLVRNGFDIQDWKWQLTEIDTADETHEITLQGKLVEIGAMTPGEVRGLWASRFDIDAEMPDMTSIPTEALGEIEKALKSIKS